MQHRPAVPASYAVSVRQAGSLPQASFRFHLTVDTLAVLANASHYQVRSGLAPYSELTCLAHKKRCRLFLEPAPLKKFTL